jgi:hypothetical protein
LWKIDGKHLVTRGNLWQSNDSWTFSNINGTSAHIKNNSSKTVLAATNTFTVNEEIFNQNDIQQRWRKGVENSEGYFTLTNVYSQKVLTAISKDSLETKGIKKQREE